MIIAAALLASPAQAQTATDQTPAPAQAPAPTPEPKHKLSGTATVSASVEAGRTDLTGVQVDIAATRPYSPTAHVDMSFSYAYATTAPPGKDDRVTVADRLTASIDLDHDYEKRLVMMLRAQALRDPVAQINYRVAEMAGFGLRFGNKRVKFRVLPGVAFLTDDKNLIDDGFRVHYGIYEDFTATITPAWSLTHYLSVSRGFADPRDVISALDTRLTGTVTKRLSIQLSYQYNFERILPAGVEPQYQKSAVGLQYRF